MAGIVLSVGLSFVFAWLGTSLLGNYGWSVFVGLPFSMGFLAALIYGFHEERAKWECVGVANLTVVLLGVGFLVFAFEGMICLAMAAPIACGMATMGGLVAALVQKTFLWRGGSSRLFCAAILLAPVGMTFEQLAPPELPLFQVRTTVVVNAPPEGVWKNVVSFSELPPPRELIFLLGIAYPIRAEIYGRGPGAVRHCNFSTGPFVEPIEIWDEPQKLKFSVTHNPEPMQEWTPYREVHPPHLNGYLESKAGQFQLTRLEGGRTLLEGTTWYHHRLWPVLYWKLWSDQIIHTIHRRVLNHVKALAEEKHSSEQNLPLPNTAPAEKRYKAHYGAATHRTRTRVGS